MGVYGLARLVRFCLRGVLGLVARLGGSLGLRASSPLPSGSRLPPSPKGDGFGACAFWGVGV